MKAKGTRPPAILPPMRRPESFPERPPRQLDPAKLHPEDIPGMMYPHSAYEVDWAWNVIERLVADDLAQGVDLDPPFQRVHRWTDEQRRLFCEYVLCGGETGKVLIFAQTGERAWEMGRDYKYQNYVLVDGKQRLESVRRLVRGELRVFPRPERPEGYLWEELGDGFTRMTTARFHFRLVVLPTYADILRLYLKFNAGGTPHTPAELDKVRDMLEPLPVPPTSWALRMPDAKVRAVIETRDPAEGPGAAGRYYAWVNDPTEWKGVGPSPEAARADLLTIYPGSELIAPVEPELPLSPYWALKDPGGRCWPIVEVGGERGDHCVYLDNDSLFKTKAYGDSYEQSRANLLAKFNGYTLEWVEPT
jgi:hypothetical protein